MDQLHKFLLTEIQNAMQMYIKNDTHEHQTQNANTSCTNKTHTHTHKKKEKKRKMNKINGG